MEKTTPAFSMADILISEDLPTSFFSLLCIIVLRKVLSWIKTFHEIYSRLLRLLHFLFTTQIPSSEPRSDHVNGAINDSLDRSQVEMVMEKLGIFSNGTDELQVRVGADYLAALFEENEASFEEVKGAFDVFDENRDGFIDAHEVQKVVSALGFAEACSEMEQCRRMIAAIDEDGDGRIDFREFLKLLENGPNR
ncbi:probable calcium-binding protein CML45 [Diospyros lotus]|uniref:probable calcium-binding protein CML45 n=1 Tax=Diospyros lotus TaxID=55363 RepID=UPI002259A67D|nr:probable calcium-binding protein CML45 [Diospyros lotus]